MGYSAKILADSISRRPHEVHRLTTMEVTFPRIVLAEFNTHRVFSRNSASSRAIPVEKRIAAIESDPFVPEAFGKNQKGMQASDNLGEQEDIVAREVWLNAKDMAVKHAKSLAELGVHKQLANRLIEPFCWHTVVVTSTEWENFFALRCHINAQPEIRKIAELMRDAYEASVPKRLTEGQWHLPFVDEKEAAQILEEDRLGLSSVESEVVAHVSVGRCARVSYLTHDGKRDWKADVALAKRLHQSGHMSPFEHVARPMSNVDIANNNLPFLKPFLGNFCGWVQLRKLLPNEDNFGKVLSSCS